MASSIPMNPTPQHIAALLPKLHDADPDYRFMSLNDLFQVLTVAKQDFLHHDYNTASRTVDGIIKTLDDQNGEVQNLAIKCLGPLVTKLQGSILAPLIDKLANLTTKHSVDNSIPAMALRTVVVTLPRPAPGVPATHRVNEAYTAISKALIPKLVGHSVVPASSTKASKVTAPVVDLTKDDLDVESVDVMIEVIRCFGPMLHQVEVEALQHLIVEILSSNRANPVLKKRAVVAVSILAIYLTDDLLSAFVSQLIETLRNPHLTLGQRKIYINILGSMARSIPTKFGPYLKTLAPFVLSALSEQELEDQIANAVEDGEPDQEVDNVREAALVALEAFIAACSGEMRFYTDETIKSALRFLKYDPNYNGDDDEEMGGTQDDADDLDELDEDEDFDAGDDFDDDDDDASWKVRRCAAKVLYTLISTRGIGDLLEDGTLYSQVAPALVQRFSEREENVRLEVIATLSSLVRKTGKGILLDNIPDEGQVLTHVPPSRKRRRASSTALPLEVKSSLVMSAGLISPAIEQAPETGPRSDLAKLVPTLVRSGAKLLKSSSVATKQAVLNLWDDIISIQHGGLSEYFSLIVDSLATAVKPSPGSTASSNSVTTGGAATATSNTLRIAALKLVGDIAKTHSSRYLQPLMAKVAPSVVISVTDRFYKISTAAVGTVEELVKVLTPPRSQTLEQSHAPLLRTFHEAIIGRVSATDADLEVRQAAIHALGVLIARTSGSQLVSANDRSVALDLLLDRLRNETTRLAAIKAIDAIAAYSTSTSALPQQWTGEVVLELSAQLRKSDRLLRGASLGALKNLVGSPATDKSFDDATSLTLLQALLPLINLADLHLVGPALLVLAALINDHPKLVTASINNAICTLLLGTLNENVVDALVILITSIGQKGVGQPLMKDMLHDVSIKGDPTVVGKAIGTLLVAGGTTLQVSVESFLKELQAAQDDKTKCLALAVLGEAGLRLGPSSNLQPAVFMSLFSARSEIVPIAAAVALGRAGAGNIKLYMGDILKVTEKDENQQYLLLHSIKEILNQAAINSIDIHEYAKPIWNVLLAASNAEDNKAVAAECMGRLAIIDPSTYVRNLQNYLRDPTPSIRAMAIQAIRYALPDSDENFDTVLKESLVPMLTTMMQDPERENCRLALTTINAAAHSKPELLIPNLGMILPLVMEQTHPRKDLMREVMMGPFKHKVDDGLELRKSAYETLYAIMEIAFSAVNLLEFYDRVVAGLRDDHDIRGLCNLMLTKLVILDPDETTRRLDAVAECFRGILSTKLKDNAVKQEIEKQDEAIKGALRVTLVLHAAFPAATSTTAATSGSLTGQHQVWRDYLEWVEKEFVEKLKGLRNEATAAASSV